MKFGRCRVCGKQAALSDLQWSNELRSEACDRCRQDAEKRKQHKRGPR